MGLTHLEEDIVENQREIVVLQLGTHHRIANGCWGLEKTTAARKTLYKLFQLTLSFRKVVD